MFRYNSCFLAIERLATSWTVRGSNTGGGEIFRTCPDRPWGPPGLLYNGYRVFPGGKERPGRDADPSPPSSAVVIELYLYSPYGPYGLYRTSVPVQGCTLPSLLRNIVEPIYNDIGYTPRLQRQKCCGTNSFFTVKRNITLLGNSNTRLRHKLSFFTL